MFVIDKIIYFFWRFIKNNVRVKQNLVLSFTILQIWLDDFA